MIENALLHSILDTIFEQIEQPWWILDLFRNPFVWIFTSLNSTSCYLKHFIPIIIKKLVYYCWWSWFSITKHNCIDKWCPPQHKFNIMFTKENGSFCDKWSLNVTFWTYNIKWIQENDINALILIQYIIWLFKLLN